MSKVEKKQAQAKVMPRQAPAAQKVTESEPEFTTLNMPLSNRALIFHRFMRF